MIYTLHGVRYNPNIDSIAIALRPQSKRLPTSIIDLYTTQTELQARANAAGRTAWSDEDVIAEASAQLAVDGDTVVAVCPHSQPLNVECTLCNPPKPATEEVEEVPE